MSTSTFEKVNDLINSEGYISQDQRALKDQLIDLLTLARKLKMYDAVDWLQPKVLDIRG